MNLTQLIEYIYTQETKDVELTAQDYRKIAKAIEDAAQGRDKRMGKKGLGGEIEEEIGG